MVVNNQMVITDVKNDNSNNKNIPYIYDEYKEFLNDLLMEQQEQM